MYTSSARTADSRAFNSATSGSRGLGGPQGRRVGITPARRLAGGAVIGDRQEADAAGMGDFDDALKTRDLLFRPLIKWRYKGAAQPSQPVAAAATAA